MSTEKAIEILGNEIVDILEHNDMTVTSVYQRLMERGGDGSYNFELEFFSPEGEDIVFDISAFGKEDFVTEFRKYAEDFDPDEHAALWIENRGQRGCPDSITALIADARAIGEILKQTADNLEGLDTATNTNIREDIISSLTAEEKEKVYREVELQYRIYDARNHVREELDHYEENTEEYKELSSLTDDDYESLAYDFLDTYDCNRAENDQWETIIHNYLSEE